MDEIEMALSLLKSLEEDLNQCDIDSDVLYYKYRTYYNIAHLCNISGKTKSCIKYLTKSLETAEECNSVSTDTLHFYVSNSRLQEVYYNRAKANSSIWQYVNAIADICIAIELSHKSLDENTDIVKMCINNKTNQNINPDNLIDDGQLKEIIRIANKQWDSAIAFLASAYWAKSEILEKQGKITESASNYENLLKLLENKLINENSDCAIVIATRSKLKMLNNPPKLMSQSLIVFKSTPK